MKDCTSPSILKHSQPVDKSGVSSTLQRFYLALNYLFDFHCFLQNLIEINYVEPPSSQADFSYSGGAYVPNIMSGCSTMSFTPPHRQHLHQVSSSMGAHLCSATTITTTHQRCSAPTPLAQQFTVSTPSPSFLTSNAYCTSCHPPATLALPATRGHLPIMTDSPRATPPSSQVMEHLPPPILFAKDSVGCSTVPTSSYLVEGCRECAGGQFPVRSEVQCNQCTLTRLCQQPKGHDGKTGTLGRSRDPDSTESQL